MKKIIKIVLIVILAIILGILSVPFLFKGKILNIVQEEINNNVNAKVEFTDFNLSILKNFPDLSIEMSELTVAGVDTFKHDTLLTLNSFLVSIDVMSAISGDTIKVKTIVLDQPNIHAIVLDSALANYEITPESEETEEAMEDTSTESSSFSIALNKFAIINANIKYDDHSSDLYSEIKNLNFNLSGDMSADFTSLITTLTIDEVTVLMEGIKYLNKTVIGIDANIDADIANSTYTFNKNSFRINELELGLNGFIKMLEESYEMDLAFDTKKTSFKTLLSMIPAIYMTDFNDVKTEGKLALNGDAKGIYNDNSLPSFHLNLLVEDAMFKYPDLPGSAENINIDLKIFNEGTTEDETVVNLEKFHINMASIPIDMHMKITTPISDPNIDGGIKGKIDFIKIKDVVPLDSMTLEGLLIADVKLKGKMSSIEAEQYEDFMATGQIGLNNFKFESSDLPQGMTISTAQMSFTPMHIELQEFNSIIGKSDIQANGKFENYLAYALQDSLLTGIFNLNSGVMDVNQFMTEDEIESEASPEAIEDTAPLEVVEIPKNINFLMNTKMGTVYYDNLTISNLSGAIHATNGMVIMKDVFMNMLDGSILITGNYSSQNITKPSYDFNMDIKEFDISKSFEAFNTVQKIAPIAEHCTGAFSAKLGIASDLDSEMMPVMNTLNGAGQLQTKELVITESDALSKIGKALKNEKLSNNLAVNDANIKFTIKDGKITIDPVNTKIGDLATVFGGWQGVDQTLHYDMDLTLPRKSLGGKANGAIDDLFSAANAKGVNVKAGDNVDVKVDIGGTLTDPKISLDLKDAAGNAKEDLKDQAKEELDKKKAELKAKAKAEAEALKQKTKEEADKLKKEAEEKAKEAEEKAKVEADKLKKEAEAAAEKKKKETEEKAKKEAKKKLKGLF